MEIFIPNKNQSPFVSWLSVIEFFETPNLESALRHVPHGPDIPIPLLDNIPALLQSKSDDNSDDEFQVNDCSEPVLFSQSELNNLTPNLAISRDSAHAVVPLQEKNLLTPGTSFTWFQNQEKDCAPYFPQDGELVNGSDVSGLMQMFIIQHKVADRRLFIDSSQTSLRAVLLHNGNKYASIPVRWT